METPLPSWPEKKFLRLTALLLAVATFALFSPAIGYEFLNYDDDLYVYNNAAVQAGLSPAGVAYAFTSRDVGTWAPLTWLSYQADTTLLGARASSYHFTNILLHTAAGVALFFALVLLLRRYWASVLVAGIFLLHPLRTESVVWIAERKDVVFALFWALGLWAYAGYSRRSNAARWALVFLCFLGGMMSKFMMATFPFVLLLLDFWPLNRAGENVVNWRARVWPLVREKIPFFLAVGVFHRFTVSALDTTEALQVTGPDIGGRLARVVENYSFYLGKIFWPAARSLLYPLHDVSLLAVAGGVVLLLGLTGITMWQMRRQPWLLVGWLWFLGALVPVIGFVQFGHFFVADRYAYIPSVGLALALAVGLEHWAGRFSASRKIMAAVTAVVLAGCAGATHFDLPRWQNSLALYDAALAVGPHRTAYHNRGTTLLRLGQPARALADFNAALRLHPDYASALNNRASVWMELGNLDAALADCSAALRANPAFADAFNNRGNVHSRRGEPEQAVADYDCAIKLNPAAPLYYNNRAAAWFEQKQFARAQADLQRCRELGGQPHPGLVAALAAAAQAQP